eukprot:TRINITY_DN1880_c0_g1_i1.p1 TRINITY_DN1880_c0_g1~~TRINITY_DN1880_c0_g1_i1.p1  ORF type:complete len:281 (-),score=45.03 TRINITY_DN1880_c0_g1_i1:2388-3230(-)
MAVTTVATICILPAALYVASRVEINRRQKEWQSLGPLFPGASVERSVANDNSSLASSFHSDDAAKAASSVRFLVVDFLPPSTFGPDGEGGIRCYDPFVVMQMGSNAQRSRKIDGLFHSAEERIPFACAPFVFPLPSLDSPPNVKVFLYGRKHRKHKTAQRLMAIGTIPLRQAFDKGLRGLCIPLGTRKDECAGFLRVVLVPEVNVPEIFVADEENGSMRGEKNFESGRRRPFVAFSADHEAVLAVPDLTPVTPGDSRHSSRKFSGPFSSQQWEGLTGEVQ